MPTRSPALPTPLTEVPRRVRAIDLLRGLTMVLMIFVNDLWSLTAIPAWLEHVPPGVDGIGLADTIFPAFLFIVGLSLPYALDARRQRGATLVALLAHVISRSVALLIMGVFLVNGESINPAATGLSRGGWNTLCCLSFILIWTTYPKTLSPWLARASKAVGVLVLLLLALFYRGGEQPLGLFAPQWWGILGLIGWSYLAAGLVTVLARNRLSVLVLSWLGFVLISLAHQADLLPGAIRWLPSAIGGGTLAGLAVGGVVIARLFQVYAQRGDAARMTLVFGLIAAGLIGLSIFTRPLGGLSKLEATPAWSFLCSALTLLAFTGLYWLGDVGGRANWFSLIKPAGTDTLLCYLLPYLAYALVTLLPFSLPAVLLRGSLGLLKSFLFALGCAWITGWLNRAGVRLKL
ncbi:DUF5009 domain-containing protein [Fibrella forsythiae]|uniref:DUF5009 domain-containing protein n=1 Tax=Fibrella forsythiae TaxID=2817061 RepID=A0ABS3JR89_9BACT|nr:DUF5009 domain-containing protein [Fibrella forsythiae]MBO0952512.1 DUF5009 domain-containing protein [Fibrella forsythiae]